MPLLGLFSLLPPSRNALFLTQSIPLPSARLAHLPVLPLPPRFAPLLPLPPLVSLSLFTFRAPNTALRFQQGQIFNHYYIMLHKSHSIPTRTTFSRNHKFTSITTFNLLKPTIFSPSPSPPHPTHQSTLLPQHPSSTIPTQYP